MKRAHWKAGSLILLTLVTSGIGYTQVDKIESCSCHRLLHLELFDLFRLMDWPDSAISPYDTKEFKEGLIEQLMEGFGKERSDGYKFSDMDFRNVFYPRLTDVYEIGGDTSFLMLKYWIHRLPGDISVMPPRGVSIYAGYVLSSKKLYLLSQGFGVPLEERFNQMLEENHGTQELSNICKSNVLVRLKSPDDFMAVVNDSCDLKVWVRAKTSLFYDFLEGWEGRRSLFVFFPSKDEEVLRAMYLYPETACKDEFMEPFQRRTVTEAMDSITIAPLSESRVGDTTFVSFTAWHSGWVSDEIATWEVALSNSGLVLWVHRTDSYGYGPRRL